MRRACLFCNRAADSIEHALPRWISDNLGAPGWRVIARLDDEVTADYTTASPEMRARVVCQRCNNGWMSGLEARCRPTLDPLLRGFEVSLLPGVLKDLTLWVTKTAFLMDYVRRGPVHLPDGHAAWLLEHREPPPELHVYLACREYPLNQAVYTEGSFVHGTRPEGTPTPDGYCITFAVVHLLAQVWYLPGAHPPTVEGVLQLAPGHHDDPVVWPVNGAVLAHSELHRFAKRFAAVALS